MAADHIEPPIPGAGGLDGARHLIAVRYIQRQDEKFVRDIAGRRFASQRGPDDDVAFRENGFGEGAAHTARVAGDEPNFLGQGNSLLLCDGERSVDVEGKLISGDYWDNRARSGRVFQLSHIISQRGVTASQLWP